MPKKTRQEKVVAQLKRLQQQQAVVSNSPESNLAEKQPTLTISTDLKSLETKAPSEQITQKTVVADYSYVYKDLRKTLIFVSVAIIFEIILSRIV